MLNELLDCVVDLCGKPHQTFTNYKSIEYYCQYCFVQRDQPSIAQSFSNEDSKSPQAQGIANFIITHAHRYPELYKTAVRKNHEVVRWRPPEVLLSAVYGRTDNVFC